MTDYEQIRDAETLRQLLTRWTLATIFVLAAHGGAALAIAHWPDPASPAGEPPAAVMIELAPLPVAPEAPQQDVAVGVQQEMSAESTPTEAKEEPVKEDPEPEVEPAKTEPIKEPPPEPIEREVKEEIELPPLPEVEKAAAVLDPPAPPPPEAEKVEEKKPEEKKVRKPKPKPKPRRRSVAQTAAAPKPVDAARAQANAAPTSGVGSSASVATWRGSVMAHLNRHKRYPAGGGLGTSSIAFTIDRSGRVLSARLIRSSGSAVLDQEAVALARRASPLPAPPANMGGGSIVLSVPIRFSR
jgi:protein TonB